MSLPNKSPSASSTDRAVKIAVAVLLPTVFGFLAIRHAWPTPATPPRAIMTTDSSIDDSRQSERLATPEAATVPIAMDVQALLGRVVPATSDFNVATESQSLHAPLQLSMAGRAVVDPRALAPTALPHRGQQALRNELADVATELDLYGSAPRPDNRFARMKKEVLDTRSNRVSSIRELAEARIRKAQKVQRARSQRGRQAIGRNLFAEFIKARDKIYDRENPRKPRFQPLKNWLVGRSDLEGLPLVMGDECLLEQGETTNLHKVSTIFRSARRLKSLEADDAAKDKVMLDFVRRAIFLEHDVPGVVQVLSAEKTPLRLELVKILSSFQTPEAASALVRLATYDVSADVRTKAVAALKHRRPEVVREELLAGMRYVWPPAANNAAKALVSLGDRDAYDQLANLAVQADPRAPYKTDSNQWAAHELVRVNHMRNCLLCHAPVVETSARAAGVVPSPYEPIPVEYYSSSDYQVRADVTYLRQDFSVVHAVKDHGPWPEQQRFDYFVRERKLSDAEATELSARYADDLYPQRAAILYAMRRLAVNNP